MLDLTSAQEWQSTCCCKETVALLLFSALLLCVACAYSSCWVLPLHAAGWLPICTASAA